MQIGFLTRTPRGRCVTEKAYRHLNKPLPVDLNYNNMNNHFAPDASGQISLEIQ